MADYRGIDVGATSDLLRQAQARIEERRKRLRAEREREQERKKCSRVTSTRLPVSHDFQDSQDRQDLHESPNGDITPSVVCKDEMLEDSEFLKAPEISLLNPSDLTEKEFVGLAWAESGGKSWQEHNRSPTWDFCRYLRSHPNFADLRSAALIKKLRKLIDLEEGDLETIALEWGRVKFAKGRGPLEWAVLMANQQPIHDPDEMGLERYDRFLSIAGWLQVQHGSEPIYLPVTKLANVLNVSPRQVSTYRDMAKGQKILNETAGYVRGRTATEFLFAVEKFGTLRERKNL